VPGEYLLVIPMIAYDDGAAALDWLARVRDAGGREES